MYDNRYWSSEAQILHVGSLPGDKFCSGTQSSCTTPNTTSKAADTAVSCESVGSMSAVDVEDELALGTSMSCSSLLIPSTTTTACWGSAGSFLAGESGMEGEEDADAMDGVGRAKDIDL